MKYYRKRKTHRNCKSIRRQTYKYGSRVKRAELKVTTKSPLHNSGGSASLENCDPLMISRSQKRTGHLNDSRNFQVWKRGGAMTPIENKPIVVLFFHGGLTLPTSDTSCKIDGLYQLKQNVQYMHVGHPGEFMMGSGKHIYNFIRDPNSRKTTFEPLFNIHSMSDLTKLNAVYKNISGVKPSDPKKLKQYREIKPFSGDGSSFFESNLRAKEGSVITDDRLGVHSKFEMQYMSMHVHYPDGRVENIPLTSIYEKLEKGAFPEKEIHMRLSDYFEYLERSGIYNPDIGIGLIQISCHGLERSSNLKDKSILSQCEEAMKLWHIADTEYKTLDLLDSNEIIEKYKYPIIMPVDIPYPKLTSRINALFNLMNINND